MRRIIITLSLSLSLPDRILIVQKGYAKKKLMEKAIAYGLSVLCVCMCVCREELFRCQTEAIIDKMSNSP
jgi:translation elongation factor EF-1beta